MITIKKGDRVHPRENPKLEMVAMSGPEPFQGKQVVTCGIKLDRRDGYEYRLYYVEALEKVKTGTDGASESRNVLPGA